MKTKDFIVLTSAEMREEREIVSNDIRAAAPCSIAAKCANGKEIMCATFNPGETCVELWAGVTNHEGLVGIRCGSQYVGCNDDDAGSGTSGTFGLDFDGLF